MQKVDFATFQFVINLQLEKKKKKFPLRICVKMLILTFPSIFFLTWIDRPPPPSPPPLPTLDLICHWIIMECSSMVLRPLCSVIWM